MSSTFFLPSILRNGRRGLPSPSSVGSISITTSHHHHNIMNNIHQQLRHKHQVRVILTKDLPEGQMRGVYAGEVHNVAAGYARNYLIPKKMAVYATQANFERCGLIDPEIAAKEEALMQTQLSDEESEDLRAADILRRYLRNKTVRMIRNVDPNLPTMCHPGHVDAKALRVKLSKQLKIDLEGHEVIHIRNEPIIGLEEKDEGELMEIIKGMDEEDLTPVMPVVAADEGAEVAGDTAETTMEASDHNEDGEGNAEKEEEVVVAATDTNDDTTEDGGELKDCDTKVKQLGEYVARITLAGGYIVPLKFRIDKR